MKRLSKHELAGLERVIETDIPGLRREIGPKYNTYNKKML